MSADEDAFVGGSAPEGSGGTLGADSVVVGEAGFAAAASILGSNLVGSAGDSGGATVSSLGES